MRTKSLGRFGSPDYVTAIMHLFNDQYPDNLPTEFQITTTLRYFWAFVEAQLKEEKEVSIYSIGKFRVRAKATRTGTTQYYPSFKFSNHFTLRVRDYKGTLTESELRQLKEKKAFMKAVWEKRRQHTKDKRGTETTSKIDAFKEYHESDATDYRPQQEQ